METMSIDWQKQYAERARSASSSLGNLLGLSSRPGVISLAGGFPAAELFPVEAFREALARVMASDARVALQYGPTQGYLPLRGFLAERLSRLGVQADPEEMLITTGSQQGLDLVARVFVDPGSLVVVEDPTYLGGLEAFNGSQARYVAVPADQHGMRVDLLEDILPGLRLPPRLIYALPNFQNPSGGTLSLERRHRLLELAHRYGIPIVEDDPYGELRYEGDHLPSLKALDTEGTVIHLGTFSKVLAPGLRIGWVVAPREVIQQLSRAKQAADLHSDSLAQHAAHEVCRTGLLEEHVERMKPVYRERRDAMLRSLEHHLPEATWSRPLGGLFVWATLPEGLDTAALLAEALREGVAYIPGAAFRPHGERSSSLRLNFSNVSPASIEEGVRRLGRVLESQSQAQTEVPSPLPLDLAAEAA